MRVSTTLAAFAATIPLTNAYWKGFNVAANNPDGSCKTQGDWETAFNKLKSLPQDITSVRLYASSDCNTLQNAVPAALVTGTQILVGVWAEDEAHYTAEKNALKAAINAHGSDWIIAISVGSEDLYRGDTDASTLAQQIYDVRGMVRAMGVEQEVGHVDTWTAWVDDSNKEVITAADFIGMDGYPYFQNSAIGDAASTFWQSVDATRNQVNAVSPGKWVWVTETGWPVSNTTNTGAAVASVANAQNYWRTVACKAFESVHIFWYAYQDYNESPSFGIFGKNGHVIYDGVQCP
jgi:exo-beta-1,3-glucanase (GH17 family)